MPDISVTRSSLTLQIGVPATAADGLGAANAGAATVQTRQIAAEDTVNHRRIAQVLLSRRLDGGT
jgi:hypothetical protein